jgi:D-alanyl-D-alanine carboxypeptidase
MAKLAAAYLRRFPYALGVHSMQSYTYGRSTHRNANRLLGTCPGVDGLKTGFVCASGYNFIATAHRGDHRLVAVLLGARSPGVRAAETAKLINQGYASLNIETPPIYAAMKAQPDQKTGKEPRAGGRSKVSLKKPTKKSTKTAASPAAGSKAVKIASSKTGAGSAGAAATKTKPSVGSTPAAQMPAKTAAAQKTAMKANALVPSAAKGGKQAACSAGGMASEAAPRTVAKTVSAKEKTTAKTVRNVPENKLQASKTPTPNEAPSGKKKQTAAKVRKSTSSEKQKVLSPPAARKTGTSPRPS